MIFQLLDSASAAARSPQRPTLSDWRKPFTSPAALRGFIPIPTVWRRENSEDPTKEDEDDWSMPSPQDM